MDHHSGNGRRDLFHERRDVPTVPIVVAPEFAYPYISGYPEERGAGDPWTGTCRDHLGIVATARGRDSPQKHELAHRDILGRPVPGGVYFVRLQAAAEVSLRQLVRLR